MELSKKLKISADSVLLFWTIELEPKHRISGISRKATFMRIICRLCIFKSVLNTFFNPKVTFLGDIGWLKNSVYSTNTACLIWLWIIMIFKNSHQRCSIKKLFLKILQYFRKTPVLTPVKMFPCEYCKIFKNGCFWMLRKMAIMTATISNNNNNNNKQWKQ